MGTKEVCIGELKRLKREADRWFEFLAKDCEYGGDPLCLNKEANEGDPGLVFCKTKECPLI